MRRNSALLTMMMMALMLLVAACGGKPEEKIADHLEEMTEIMDDNMDSPKDGVVELREYMHDNLPEMTEQIGVVIVELDKIEDDKERVERVKEMMEALEEPGKAFTKKMEEFQGKVAGDEAAQKELMGFVQRFGAIGEGLGLPSDPSKLMRGL